MHIASRNILEIDLDKLHRNIQNISKLINPAKIAVAVKANAYGHGIISISKKLEEIGVEFLCVATYQEALLLRESNIKTQILLLSEPKTENIDELIKQNITLSVYSNELIAELANRSQRVKAHLKINTGMNRVGCRTEEVEGLVKSIIRTPNIDLEGIYTHFPAADDPSNETTLLQLKAFQYELDVIGGLGVEPKFVHSANSAAAISIPESRLDMVRVGLSAFGYFPSSFMENMIQLEPIASLYSEVSYVHRIKAGETVSYTTRYKTLSDTNVAVLPIGYADGVPRNLGFNGGKVLIDGDFYPIIGAVTMDQLMVDIADKRFEIGTKVTLLGQDQENHISADNWAESMDTISYEILCGIGPRVERRYV